MNKGFYALFQSLLLVSLLLNSTASASNGYTEPAYRYRWAGNNSNALINKYWDTPEDIRAAIQAYMDSEPPADKYLGPMEQEDYWKINGRSYQWGADTYKKSTGAKEPGGIGNAEMLAFCPAGES